MSISKLLRDAKAEGLAFHVSYGGEVDYAGSDVSAALAALNACDEMELRLVRNGEVVAWVLYIAGLEADEQIADYSVDCKWRHLFDD